MAFTDKRDYYTPGETMYTAEIKMGVPVLQRPDYTDFKMKELMHAFYKQFEEAFAEIVATPVINEIEKRGNVKSNIKLKIPKQAIFDFLSVCDLEIRT